METRFPPIVFFLVVLAEEREGHEEVEDRAVGALVTIMRQMTGKRQFPISLASGRSISKRGREDKTHVVRFFPSFFTSNSFVNWGPCGTIGGTSRHPFHRTRTGAERGKMGGALVMRQGFPL